MLLCRSVAPCALLTCLSAQLLAADTAPNLRSQALTTIHKAATFYHTEVATHGGYVYHYTLDLKTRWGEGPATETQIWVQPPGTPTVGMAYLKAYDATGDRFYLDAAREAAEAIVYGQLESGGWTNMIDFDPRGETAQYRNGRGRGKNNSSLDDGQTESATQLLIRTDQALGFEHKAIHEAAQIALNALLAAQFPNGAFPQVWDENIVPDPPVMKASYPDYDWRTEGRVKNYWDMYTLNDNVTGYVAEALIDAYRIYQEEKYLVALKQLGNFLILAQMPAPQRGWAQQYNYDMNPIWARRFEPPGISGDESQEVLETLMKIFRVTGDRNYLQPIPPALAYLKRSLLPDGRLARYYELKTNRPLYMVRKGKAYTLTYDDSKLPDHYGWKTDSRLDEIEERYNELLQGVQSVEAPNEDLEAQVRQIIADLDDQRRWISTYRGERLVGQPKFAPGSPYISSEVFSKNIETLSEYLKVTRSK